MHRATVAGKCHKISENLKFFLFRHASSPLKTATDLLFTRLKTDKNEHKGKMSETRAAEQVRQEDPELQQNIRSDSKELEEKLSDAHLKVLTPKKLITVLLGMGMAIFFSFVDQSGLSVALPEIADSLNAQRTISWARHC